MKVTDVKRMWINQPSTQQPLHNEHGTNVLAAPCDYDDNMSQVWFVDGETISAVIPTRVLSLGWINH